MDFSRLALALQGFGEGVQGRGVQFNQQLEEQRKAQEQERRDAWMGSNRQMLSLLNAGDTEGALRIGVHRQQAVEKLGGDPSDSLMINKMLNSGDPAKIKEAATLMKAIDDKFVGMGKLNPMEKPEKREIVKDAYGANRYADTGELVIASDEEALREIKTQKQIANDQQRLKLNLEIEKLRKEIQGGGGLDFKDLQSLQKEVTNLTKDTSKIMAAALSLTKLSETKSPTDQLAAIFTFMKALDPTSVVREGEQEMAVRTGGITDTLLTYVESLESGKKLPDAVFNNMVKTAQRLANESVYGARETVTGYLDAFGDRIPAKTYKETMARLPKPFAMQEQQAQSTNPNTMTTDQRGTSVSMGVPGAPSGGGFRIIGVE